MAILKSVIFDSYRPLKDGSIRYSFVTTQEQNPDEVKDAHIHKDQLGLLFFKNSDSISQDELDEISEKDIEESRKTQAQRIRSTIYVLWQKDNKGYDNFNDFYRWITEHFITQLKTKISEHEE